MMEEDEDEQVRAAAAKALGLYVYLGEIEEISADDHHLVEDSLLASDGEQRARIAYSPQCANLAGIFKSRRSAAAHSGWL
jgi:hypothetical protein